MVLSADSVEIHHGWTEMGQGVDTVAVQVVCSETGPEAGTSSRAHAHERQRARGHDHGLARDEPRRQRAHRRLQGAQERPQARGPGPPWSDGRYRGKWVCDWTTKPGYDTHGKPVVTHYSYSYATQVAIVDDDGEVGELIAAHDAGKVINPTLFEGPDRGLFAHGPRATRSARSWSWRGRPKSTKLRDCGVLRASQTPKLTVIAVEVPDPIGPYGAKGVGEIGLVPHRGAVANAFWAFDGKRRRTLPMKD